tara:strand:- start:267 stop:494 length:228 start_codon:yes stop_codon:yes gene_type:complete
MKNGLKICLKEVFKKNINYAIRFKFSKESRKKIQKRSCEKRLELLIKLMPFVMPKTTNISHTTNEPFWIGVNLTY